MAAERRNVPDVSLPCSSIVPLVHSRGNSGPFLISCGHAPDTGHASAEPDRRAMAHVPPGPNEYRTAWGVVSNKGAASMSASACR